MDTLTDGIRKLLLAGVGAVATGVEKSQEIIEDLVHTGELTVEQGKQLNQELSHKADEAHEQFKDQMMQEHLKEMTPEQREAYIKHIQELADGLDTDEDAQDKE